MKRKMFKLGFRNRSVGEQLEICERILAGTASLSPEQCDPVRRAHIVEVVAGAKASHVLVEGLKSQVQAAVTRRNGLFADARQEITRLSNHVAASLDFDSAKMVSAGMELEAPKTRPTGKPAAPANLRAVAVDADDAVRLRWVQRLRHVTFIVQMTADPEGKGGWKQCDVTGRQSSLIKGLKPGVKYWFRVCATNTHGESPWSNAASARVK